MLAGFTGGTRGPTKLEAARRQRQRSKPAGQQQVEVRCRSISSILFLEK
jgi:hypothetical protein